MRPFRNISFLALAMVWTICSVVYVSQVHVQLFSSSSSFSKTEQGQHQPTITTTDNRSNTSSSTFNNNTLPRSYPPSIFPDKLFTVVGLEASGTKLLTETLRNALHLSMIGDMEKYEVFGEGYSNQYSNEQENRYFFTEIQHLSLPWGSTCTSSHHPQEHIVPVIVPGMCSKIMHDYYFQQKLLLDHQYTPQQKSFVGWDIPDQTSNTYQPFASVNISDRILAQYKIPGNEQKAFLEQCASVVGTLRYPHRHLLNLTSHLEWYQERGIDAQVVIIMRDASISRRARHSHCTNKTLLQLEEQVGMDIIQEVLEKHIFNKKNGSRRRRRRRLVEASENGKVVLVSYELLNQLQYNYLSLIYKKLGIDSTYKPLLKDGNQKHVKEGDPAEDATSTLSLPITAAKESSLPRDQH